MTKEDGLKMKRLFALILAAVMVFAFAACGEKTEGNNVQQQNTASGSAGSDSTAAPAAENAPSAAEPQQADAPGGISPAKDGTLTISKADVAVVVNGTSVPVPYNLKELEAAGVPADESRSEIKLGAGDFFSLNMYLDENEDYLLIPAYYNGGDSPISVYEAEAEEVTLTTYADNPADQGVSILGVSLGMARKDVKELLGEPDYDAGDYMEWHIEVPEMAYAGTLSMYVTSDDDEAGVSQVDLTVFAK